MRRHEWRERTDDGDQRLVKAEHHGGRWRILARLKSEPAFVELDPLPLHDLETLLEVVEGKYRWGRAPHEHLAQIQGLIEDARAREG